MSEQLTIATLGGLSIRLDGEPVTGLASRKAEALLVYLACSERPRPREVLAELLWEERSQERAMSNLRVVLSSLRKQLGPYVTITRETARLNPEADVWLDAAELERKLSAGQHGEAVALYHGDFLEGFFVRGSPGFEDWAAIERERLRRLVLDALSDLIGQCLEAGEHKAGIRHAARLLELDPLMEEAHRQMMRLLAYSGQRGAALEQYETCCQLLSEELDIAPTEETVALCERIRAGELDVPAPAPTPEPVPPAQLPAFLEAEEAAARPVFVAREGELARLDGFLETALAGQGQVVFVAGGAGRGKTALIQEFARRALDGHPDMLVALGNCNPYSGVGDPYLPFRGVLGTLTGDIEPRWAAGMVTTAHARRLWAAVPQTMQALIAHGGFLVDIFVPGRTILSRATAAAPTGASWLRELERLIERSQYRPSELTQHHLFDQYADVLRDLSTHHPLILLLDDMQWADTGSTGLLYHLGRRLEGGRVLVVCAYRPDEVALGRDGQRHPLDKVLAEFKRTFSDVWVDLAQADEAEGRHFVDAFLETEPNRLDEGFRSGLFRHTGGHALFTVELLRAMQERGDLVQDVEGYWVPGSALDWEALPARVEAVIEERIGRLEDELREVLSVASVEGEDFTAQVVARVQEVGERKLLRDLSQELEKRHRLVREQGEVRVGRYSLSRYRFAHALFQQYLYNDLSEGERRLLHRATAGALEELYEGRTDEIAVQLAHHWERAGEPGKAADYLRLAGVELWKIGADGDAVGMFERALAMLPQDDVAGRAELLAWVGWSYHNMGDLSTSVPLFREALALSRQAGLPAVEADALTGLGRSARYRGRYHDAERYLERAIELARQSGDQAVLADGLFNMGCVAYNRGDLEKAKRLAKESLALYRESGHGREIGWVLTLLGECTRRQGKYAEAVRYCEEALATHRELGLSAAGQLNNLGHAYIGLGEDDVAWGCLREALKESLPLGRVPLALEALVGVAWLRTKARRHERAAELLGLVLGHPALSEEVRRYAEPVLAMVRESLPADELEAALARGEALDLEQVVAEILAEQEG